MSRPRQKSEPAAPAGQRWLVRPAALAGGLLALIGMLLVWANRSPEESQTAASERATIRPTKVERRSRPVDQVAPLPESRPAPQSQSPAPVPRPPFSPPSESSRQLVRAIGDPRGGLDSPLTPAQAALWRQNLVAIIKAGDDSVAAIAEFLATGHDTSHGLEEKDLLGFSSSREALLDALSRIGSPQAIAAMAEVLGSATTPAEVAMLARNLEALAPGLYQAQAVSAAQAALAAAVRQPVAGVDVAPLFEVLQQFGGTEAAGDLERAATHWGHYATLVLGSLPDGGGLPSLLRIADIGPGRAPNPARLQAFQVLAQLAPSNEQARAALIGFAREGRIPAPVWPYLARPLAGEQARLGEPLLGSGAVVADDSHAGTVHIASGNQNLIWVRSEAGLSADDQARLSALLRELAAVTRDPDGLRILRQTQARIEQEAARGSGVSRSE